MKFLLSYNHYPCSIGRFYKEGFRALGHEVHSTGYCTEDWQAWPNEPRLPQWIDRPDYPLANFANVYVVDGILHEIIRSEGYDLFVNVDAAHSWRGPTPCPKVIIGTDPHCTNYDVQRQDCDLFVCMQNYYSKAEDVWIPYAYHPAYHFHEDVPIDHDVTFFGVLYRDRLADLEALKSANSKVLDTTNLVEGKLSYPVFSEGCRFYSSGHLAYCRPSLQDLPTRFFEALAYGNIPLITPVPDLLLFPKIREGWHYETFIDTKSLIDAVRRTLADPRLEERKRDCIEAVKGHTWANRAQMVLDACKERGLL